jgi:hypothetical protein
MPTKHGKPKCSLEHQPQVVLLLIKMALHILHMYHLTIRLLTATIKTEYGATLFLLGPTMEALAPNRILQWMLWGFAHITYTDSKGKIGAYTDTNDIMYATNKTDNFVNTCIFDGYLEYYGGADRYAEYFNKGSKIAVDENGTFYIAAHKYQYQTWMNGNDKQYSLAFKSTTGTGGTEVMSSDAFDIYDVAAFGSKVALTYRHSTTKFAEITGTTALTLSNIQNASATSSICSLNIDDNSMVKRCQLRKTSFPIQPIGTYL